MTILTMGSFFLLNPALMANGNKGTASVKICGKLLHTFTPFDGVKNHFTHENKDGNKLHYYVEAISEPSREKLADLKDGENTSVCLFGIAGIAKGEGVDTPKNFYAMEIF